MYLCILELLIDKKNAVGRLTRLKSHIFPKQSYYFKHF